MRVAWIAILLCCLLVACNEVVYLRNDEKPVLVLYVVLEAGCDSMWIEVTETKGTYDKSPWRRFPEAEVRVYEEGELLGMAEYQPADSSFVLRQPVKAERTYRIEARVAGKETVWGETHVPEEITDCRAELWYERKEIGTPRWTANCHWKDCPDKKNYYWFGSNSRRHGYQVDTLQWNEVFLFESDSPLPDPFNRWEFIGDQESQSFFAHYIRVEDVGVNGKELDLLFCPLAGFSSSCPLKVMVAMMNVDRGLDAYLKSCIENKDHSQPPTDEIPWTYYHPAQVYSNIHGGTGIIGSYSSSVHVLYVAKDTVGLFGPGERVK